MLNKKIQALDIHFSYLCRSTHKYKNGHSPIIFRINYRGQRRDVFTGLSCLKEHWLPQLDKVTNDCREANTINRSLEEIMYKAKDCFDRLKYSGDAFTIDELVAKIKGSEPPPQTLLEYNEIKLLEIKDRVGIDITKPTYYKYKRTVLFLNDFLNERRSVKNIPVNKIDEEFLKQLYLYIRKEKKNGHNTTVSLMNCLKSILRTALKKGVLKNNPFDDFPLTKNPVHRDYLSLEDIALLQNAEGLTEAQQRNRDLFLLGCYTGLAYAEIKKLAARNIKLDPDGSKHIMDARKKTDIMSIIPLLPVAENILLKYSPTGNCRDFVWKVPTNQKLNASLKEIAKKAGVEKTLFMHLARHTFATTITLSHGVPLESVSKMLGHTTLKHTHIYAKIVASKVKDDMSKLMGIFN